MPERLSEPPRSWVATRGEAEQRRREATALVGQRVSAVRYVNLDYEHMEHGTFR